LRGTAEGRRRGGSGESLTKKIYSFNLEMWGVGQEANPITKGKTQPET